METRARYVLIGVFAFVVIAAGFVFVYWLNHSGGLSQRTVYRIGFSNSVSGLLPGSTVLFDGIRVGEVADLSLDPANPNEVIVTIAVAPGTPVRADTHVGMDFRGLTGAPSVALTGGTVDLPILASNPEGPLVLTADPSAAIDLAQAARQALGHLDQILVDNSDALKKTIANLQTFSEALGRNSDRVDNILKGLDKLTGGGGVKVPPVTFDLTIPATLPAIAKLPDGQLAIAEPTAVVALQTQRILVATSGGMSPTFDDTQWSDNIPLLVQERIVQAMENAGYPRVAKASDDFAADNKLAIDLRSFDIGAGNAAEVSFTAKVLTKDGVVIAARLFSATAPVKANDAANSAAALNEAFGNAVVDLIPWALATVAAAPAAPPAASAP